MKTQNNKIDTGKIPKDTEYVISTLPNINQTNAQNTINITNIIKNNALNYLNNIINTVKNAIDTIQQIFLNIGNV